MIVGAGVVGLSTAVHLYERFGDSLHLTLLADAFSPYTTADQAGTIIVPLDWNVQDAANLSQNEENKKIQRWAETTIKRYLLFLETVVIYLTRG